MTLFALIYEPDSLTGLPSLRLLEGPAGAVSAAELGDLDRELKARYEQLRRESSSTLHVRSRHYAVENKDPNGPRQPTLIIRPITPNGSVAVDPKGKAHPASWTEGFYAKVAKMVADPAVQRLEAYALRAAVEELQAAVPNHSAMLAATLMASYLALSEQLCRGQDPDRAGMYALALRGLGRLLPESTEEGAEWRRLNPTGRAETQSENVKSHWLWRVLSRMIGLTNGDETAS